MFLISRQILLATSAIIATTLLIVAGLWLKNRNVIQPFMTAPKSASLKILPEKQTLRPGDEFAVTIQLDSGGQAINTVAAHLKFPQEFFEFVDFDLSASFASTWFERQVKNGEIILTGSLPTPGFSGQGTLIKLRFRAIKGGEATIAFDEKNSTVFTDLGNFDILGKTSGATYIIAD